MAVRLKDVPDQEHLSTGSLSCSGCAQLLAFRHALKVLALDPGNVEAKLSLEMLGGEPADGETAVLEVNGQRARYKMGGAISLQFNEPTTTSKQIYADQRGMFHTVGSINGYTVNFLVDTGATTIAMNANQARRLGLDFRLQGELTQAQTASGVARAYYLKLDIVKVGDISQRNVDALVIDGTHPREVLLGMSFLNRLKVEKQGNVLHLEHRR